jgi:hypothetical protein
MSRQPEKQPIAKTKEKQQSLPKTQRKIVLCLAEQGAKDISEINKSINGYNNGNYKSVNIAVHKLEEKGLIKKYGSKDYKRISYPRYWLTRYGTFLALSDEKTDLTKLASQIEAYPNNDLCMVKPLVAISKDALPQFKPVLQDIFTPLFKDYKLDQSLAVEPRRFFDSAGDGSEDLRALFDLFLSVRNKFGS